MSAPTYLDYLKVWKSGATYKCAKTVTGEVTGRANSLVVKDEPGILFEVFCYNAHTADVYVQVHDASAVGSVSAGAIPRLTFVAPNAYHSGITTKGVPFTSGIVLVVSSTPTTYTAHWTANTCHLTATYR